MRVLLAIDDSPFSAAAVRALATQVHPKGTQILIVRALEPLVHTVIPRMEPIYSEELSAQLAEDRKEVVESTTQVADELRRAGFQVDTRVLENEARSAILDVAAGWGADLIVLGSHGRKGFSKFLLGSVAESVARHANCSVWIVRIPRRT